MKQKLSDYFYLMPAVLLIGSFFMMSIGYTLYMSFFEWDGFSSMHFVGLDNYITLFSDANFQVSLLNTLIWVVCSLLVSFLIPLLLAILVTNSSFLSLYKFIFYLPSALSGTVGGLIIGSLLSVNGLPQVFKLIGLDNLAVNWLAIPKLNTFIMIGASVWQGIGLNFILFIVGLLTIPSSPIEAAIIDGAGTIRKYFSVIFPLLRSTIVVVVLMTLINSFKAFDSIWVMTKGGPFRSSETLALTMYVESFVRNHIGFGAAVAVTLSIMILCISYFNIRRSFSPADE